LNYGYYGKTESIHKKTTHWPSKSNLHYHTMKTFYPAELFPLLLYCKLIESKLDLDNVEKSNIH